MVFMRTSARAAVGLTPGTGGRPIQPGPRDTQPCPVARPRSRQSESCSRPSSPSAPEHRWPHRESNWWLHSGCQAGGTRGSLKSSGPLMPSGAATCILRSAEVVSPARAVRARRRAPVVHSVRRYLISNWRSSSSPPTFLLATRARIGRRACGEGFSLVRIEVHVADTPVIVPAYGG